MSTFEVVALGVGDTFSEIHHTASLLLEAEGFRLAIDCPDRYRGVLKKARERSRPKLTVEEIDHMFITHVHGDHMNGLEGVAFYKRFAEGKRLHLYSTQDVRDVIWEQRLRAPMETLWDGSAYKKLTFDDYFAFEASPWQEAFDIGPFQVALRRTMHHVPTAAMLVRCAGKTFGYSADTAFDPGLIDFLAAADVIVHETNFGPAHTSYADLMSLSPEIRRRMRLIHYPDSFDPENSEIACLGEGDVLTL